MCNKLAGDVTIMSITNQKTIRAVHFRMCYSVSDSKQCRSQSKPCSLLVQPFELQANRQSPAMLAGIH